MLDDNLQVIEVQGQRSLQKIDRRHVQGWGSAMSLMMTLNIKIIESRLNGKKGCFRANLSLLLLNTWFPNHVGLYVKITPE